MDLSSGSSRGSKWKPVITGNTPTSSYWLNWRVLLCSIWIIMSMGLALYLVRRYEGSQNVRSRNREEIRQEPEPVGILYADEVWKPCLKGIHPAWLLAFRVIAFLVLLILLIVYIAVAGRNQFYYYTQWTFTLVIFYFGLGSLLSGYGCYHYHNKVGGDSSVELDAEQGSFTQLGHNNEEMHDRQTAGIWGYPFQIIFQMNAGAVMLSNSVFWFLIIPFFTIKHYHISLLLINMHTFNVVFLIGDSALNCLRFPWFRIAYFFIWTTVYVIFQWILHACISFWWPYPFLDLSSSYSPLWYASASLMHIPCYGIFALVMKLKHYLLIKWFPETYQCSKIRTEQRRIEPR